MRAWAAVVVLLAGCAALPSGEERPRVAREIDPSPLRFARPVRALAFAPDGKLAATDGLTVRVFDEEGDLVERHVVAASSIAFTSSSELVVADDAGIGFASGKRIAVEKLRVAAVSPGGRVAWSDEAGFWLDGALLDPSWPRTIAFSSDEKWLAAYGPRLDTPEVWRIDRGKPELVRAGVASRPCGRGRERGTLAFGDGWLAFGRPDHPLSVLPLDELRDLEEPFTHRPFEDGKSPSVHLLHALGPTLLAHTERGIESLAGSSRRVLVPEPRPDLLERVAFSPDGKRVALARGHGLEVVLLETGRVAFRTPGHGFPVQGLALSRERLASTDGLSLLVRDRSTGSEERSEASRGELVFSPDERILAAGDTLFDRSLRPLLRLPESGGFSFSGSRMTWGWEGRHVLDLDTLRSLGEARSPRVLAFAPELAERAVPTYTNLPGLPEIASSSIAPFTWVSRSVLADDAAIVVWSTAHPLREVGHHVLVRIDRRTGTSTSIPVPRVVALAPDARRIALADEESVVVRDLVARSVERWKLRAAVTALAFSPSGEVVAGLEDGSLHLLERGP